MKALLPLILSFLLAACSTLPDATSTFLNPDALPTQGFTITTSRDTTLTLAGGTQLIIPAGAIRSAQAAVQLEVKEALIMEQIVRAGLLTESGEGMLSSGGMLYVGLAEGEEATIQAPLRARIPARTASPEMKLWRGEERGDRIVWTDPQPLSTSFSASLEKGKALFQANCASCHNPAKDATGPALYRVLDRWESKKEMYAFTHNPAQMIADGHPYANCIYDRWGRTQMTAFPTLSDNELDLIHAYADAEGAKKLGPDIAEHLRSSRDSCRRLKAIVGALREEVSRAQAARRPVAAIDWSPPGSFDTTTNELFSPASRAPISSNGVIDKVSPTRDFAEYYNIDISAFGWYNIDVLLDEVKGVEKSRLIVRLQGEYTANLQLMLIIPSHKVFVEGGELAAGGEYGFYTRDGQTPLPQGVQAFILAMGEQKNKPGLLLGQASFTTTRDQTIIIEAAPTDSVRMMAAIREAAGSSVDVRVTRDKTAEEVRLLARDFSALQQKYDHECACYETRAKGDSVLNWKLERAVNADAAGDFQ